MEQTPAKEALTILRRFLQYAEKIFALSSLLELGKDSRPAPRIATRTVLSSVLVMFVARIGSLNALEQTESSSGFWRRWLRAALPSADTLGRVMHGVAPDGLRAMLATVYSKLKRNKALRPTTHGLMALAIDGHETQATYRRWCQGSLERRVKTRLGYRTQYYHRYVTAMLVCADFPLLLDVEMLEPGEGELAAAKRLLVRVLQNYPRAFDVVVGDALYSDAEIFKMLVEHNKDMISVLKQNQPDLLAEAETLLEMTEPAVEEKGGKTWRVLHDLSGFEQWSQTRSLRVVRSREGRRVRRQLDGQVEELQSQWYWLTTCSPHRASPQAIAALGHARWDIENLGFNETVTRWHADHVYKHTTEAISTFWLMTMLALNLFHAFYFRNLKADVRRHCTRLHVARCLASTLYAAAPAEQALPP